jgi:WD40 repeat protein
MASCPGAGSTGRVLLCLLLAAPALGQATVDGLRSVYVADGRTAGIQETHQLVSLLPPSPTYLAHVGDAALWRQDDNGEGWIGRVVSVGDRGTQVFTEFDTAADRAELLSGFDATPVSPLFSDPQVAASDNAKTAAARDAGIYVSCRQIPAVGQTGPRNSFVSKYSGTGGLDWTYQFAGSTNGPARAVISRDGTRIVAGMLDATGNLQVRVFDASSNVPVFSTSFLNGPQLKAFLLSADGSTLYWASSTTCTLWNVASHQTVGSFILLNSLDSHAISGDGSVFAYGGFNNVDVWERQASGSYQRTYQWAWPGQVVCSKLDVSADGSTIVAGFNIWDFNEGIVVKALDVPTKTETMSDTAIGAGSLQNIVSDVAVCDDGHHFVVGLWGDEAGLVPELRFYERNQNRPVAMFDYPGSVNDVDISPDGSRVAVGTKAVHANLYAGGGAIELYSFDDEDFIAHGIPHVGGTLSFELSSVPTSPARLLISPAAAAQPFQWANAGLLYLNRHSMWSVPMGTTGVHGYASCNFTMPTLATAIGTTLCFQGYATSPRRLTQSWVRLTVLP